MKITDEDLNDLIGTVEYRARAVKEALETGQSMYGPITLDYDREAQLLEVEAAFFGTVFDASRLSHGSDPSVSTIREKIDETAKAECEKFIQDTLWT